MLENNAGLMARDFAKNKPFFDKFGIVSGTDESGGFCVTDAT